MAVAPAAGAPPDELDGLIERHQRPLWRYLRVLGAAPDLADDLLQDTFVVALRRGIEDRGAAATGAFLRTTARHLFLKSRRRRVAEREVHEADLVWQERCGDDDGDGWFEALGRCLDGLPPRSRRLLEGAYGQDLGRTALARELGLTAFGVKTALRRLRAALRDCIERRRKP
ncbi:MAG: sigma-70 family RNA polymerase sigma factor [Planctomycetes bacterium]|nr:sigma-70 family RNA polymerase sigma factor [Planctomycetota bacterium]MCB9886127.1 sigma-70 family RNA polymerase sigma factor [Planctomycetota bacterium]